jgi:diguanylate cyclase
MGQDPMRSGHDPAGRADGGALGRRLTRLALGTSLLALLVIGTVMNVAMYVSARDELIEQSMAQARVIAANLSAAVQFGDTRAAAEILSSLQQSERTQRATVFDRGGKSFVDFRRTDLPPEALTLLGPPGPPGHAFIGSLLVVTSRIEHAGTEMGRLRFEVPMTPLYQRALLLAGTSLAAAAAALLLAWILAFRVRRDVDLIERRLDELAHVDPVTGLYNRHAAHAHLASGVAQAQARAEGFTIVTFDLDDFKTINDTLGHAVGDALLRSVAQRLTHALKPGARAYRFGGDEFVMICPWQPGFHDPQRYGEMAREVLGASMRIEGIGARATGSVGVARWPVDGLLADEVLRASDMAMYEAKARGKNQVVVYDNSLREANQQRLRLENDLRTALRENQFRLHYQPIIDLVTGRLVGAEALLRWLHPERGLVSPAQFIPTAERSGLIVELGGWVLCETVRQQDRWAKAGHPLWPVAVNVSARQLHDGRLAGQLERALDGSGIEPTLIEIELTEHTLVEDIEDNLRLLETLRQRGVRISIDDFGTGLSSLSYLKRLPAAKLKIDRSFVRDLPQHRGDRAIVEAAVSMAQALGLQVVAEGVETDEQHALLREMKCNLGQGYLYSPPLPPDEFMRWALAREVAVATSAAR